MQIVEIRLHSALLLIGKPGAIPAVMLKASDEQQLKVGLRTLETDITAMAQLRRHWRKLFPAQSSTTLNGTELARRLRREIAAGRLTAVMLKESSETIAPAPLRHAASPLVHVPMKEATLLLAPKGKLPPDLARQAVNLQTSAVLRQLDPASPSSRTLDRYAHRLPDSAIKQVSGSQLCHYVAWQVETGGYDSALLTTPMSRTLAAARPDAPMAVSRMSRSERIGEAISRSRRHLTGEILAAIEAMAEPESLAIMVTVFGAVALAQLNPATGAAVNTTLVIVAWSSAGIAGVIAIADLVEATITAMTAEHEAELDEAAKLYAEVFVALGVSLLSAIVAKFAKLRGGASETGNIVPKAKNIPPQVLAENIHPAHLPISDREKLRKILSTSKGKREEPSKYLSPEYIKDHLAEFRSGKVYKIIKGPVESEFFGKDNIFVLTESEVKKALALSKGNPRKLEKLLGMEKNYLGDSPFLMEFKNPKNIRMSTGNEQNAWGKYWRPGGYTSGGLKEAVIDGKVSRSDFIATEIKRTP